MNKEINELILKLEEARVNLDRLKVTQLELEQSIEILKQSVYQVKNPEGGLITLFLRNVSSNTDFYKSRAQLHIAGTNIEDVIGTIGKILLVDKTSKLITQLDDKPMEIKKVLAETELTTGPLNTELLSADINNAFQERKKKKRAIQGHRIPGRLAQKVEKDYGTTLTKERYFQTLESIAVHPNASYDTIKKEVNFSSNSLYAHLRYGQQAQDIQMMNNKYRLKQNGISILNSLKANFKGTIINKTNKYDRGDVQGTPLTDKDALNIHMKYDTPILEERYKKVLDILEHAVGYKRTMDEMVSQTGWSKNNTIAHLRYGIRKKEIVTFTFKDYAFYCLPKFKEMAIPKEPVSASRMY